MLGFSRFPVYTDNGLDRSAEAGHPWVLLALSLLIAFRRKTAWNKAQGATANLTSTESR